MKHVAYTIVTVNYLPYAWALRNSFLKYHSDFTFLICLAASAMPAGTGKEGVILLDELPDERIAGMRQRYNATELCCSLKPFFAEYIFNIRPDCERLVYLDSDMHFFGPLKSMPPQASLIITPHRTKNTGYLPGMDNYTVLEINRYGVYNGGYFECRRDNNAMSFLKWWQQVLEKHGYNNPDKNQFLDQLWMDPVPAFFEGVFIEKTEGYNVAFWNLIEREVSRVGDTFMINRVTPLTFYHFSHYTYTRPEKMVRFESDYLTFSRFPETKILYDTYRAALTANRYEDFNEMDPKPKKKKWYRLLRMS